MNLNAIVVLLEGFFSFFSPCILPILPLYFGYLSDQAKTVKEDGTILYNQKRIFLFTLFFIFGICTSFFLLGFSFTVLGHFMEQYQLEIAFISGIIILLFGCFQLGLFKINFFQRERKLQPKMNLRSLNLMTTYLLGFTFSFAWTPCVGPTLSSILLLVASSSKVIGIFYILLYSFGFILPFLCLGIFTFPILNFLKKKQGVLKSVVKVTGVLILLVGISLIYTNGTKLYQKSRSTESFAVAQIMEDYQGKVVVLHFLDRGCKGCQEELPLVEKLFQEYRESNVVILGVMQGDKEANQAYLDQHNYHFPVLYDDGTLERAYQVKFYPTTILLSQKGEYASKVTGVFEETYMKKLIQNIEEDPCNTSVC